MKGKEGHPCQLHLYSFMKGITVFSLKIQCHYSAHVILKNVNFTGVTAASFQFLTLWAVFKNSFRVYDIIYDALTVSRV